MFRSILWTYVQRERKGKREEKNDFTIEEKVRIKEAKGIYLSSLTTNLAADEGIILRLFGWDA